MTPADSPAAAEPEILPLGQDGILVRFGLTVTEPAIAAAQAFGAGLQADPPPGTTEVAVSLTSALIHFDPAATPRADLTRALADRLAARSASGAGLPPAARTWTIPVAFGGDSGPDLAAAAAAAGLDDRAAVAAMTGADLRVLAIGFAPGQPYIGLLPDRWDLPRQTALTPRVPEGALVVAVRQLVLFANASPTGWRWIGRSAFRPFVPDRRVPIALRQGDAIRLVAAPPEQIEALRGAPDGLGGARCEERP